VRRPGGGGEGAKPTVGPDTQRRGGCSSNTPCTFVVRVLAVPRSLLGTCRASSAAGVLHVGVPHPTCKSEQRVGHCCTPP
jgi:hypothetical protein